LLKTNTFQVAVSSKDSFQQFMRTAEGMQGDAKVPMRDPARLLLAYEGMFGIVMAVLQFHDGRPGDGGGHRATANRASGRGPEARPAKQGVSARWHDVRNRVTYRQPIPPIRKADADAMQTILDEMLPAAKVLIGFA
jgi:hypothetical protein